MTKSTMAILLLAVLCSSSTLASPGYCSAPSTERAASWALGKATAAAAKMMTKRAAQAAGASASAVAKVGLGTGVVVGVLWPTMTTPAQCHWVPGATSCR